MFLQLFTKSTVKKSYDENLMLSQKDSCIYLWNLDDKIVTVNKYKIEIIQPKTSTFNDEMLEIVYNFLSRVSTDLMIDTISVTHKLWY